MSLTDGCCAAALCHAGIALRFDCLVAAGTPWPVALDIPLAFSVVAALLGSGADGAGEGFGASGPGMLTPGTPATMLPLACPIAPEYGGAFIPEVGGVGMRAGCCSRLLSNVFKLFNSAPRPINVFEEVMLCVGRFGARIRTSQILTTVRLATRRNTYC